MGHGEALDAEHEMLALWLPVFVGPLSVLGPGGIFKQGRLILLKFCFFFGTRWVKGLLGGQLCMCSELLVIQDPKPFFFKCSQNVCNVALDLFTSSEVLTSR